MSGVPDLVNGRLFSPHHLHFSYFLKIPQDKRQPAERLTLGQLRRRARLLSGTNKAAAREDSPGDAGSRLCADGLCMGPQSVSLLLDTRRGNNFCVCSQRLSLIVVFCACERRAQSLPLDMRHGCRIKETCFNNYWCVRTLHPSILQKKQHFYSHKAISDPNPGSNTFHVSSTKGRWSQTGMTLLTSTSESTHC